jgi:hypothetical protein
MVAHLLRSISSCVAYKRHANRVELSSNNVIKVLLKERVRQRTNCELISQKCEERKRMIRKRVSIRNCHSVKYHAMTGQMDMSYSMGQKDLDGGASQLCRNRVI